MRRDYEAMSEQMAHFRAMIQRREQLDASATPGGSGSRHRVPDSVAYAAPVAHGQAAFNNPLPQPPRPRPRPRQPPLLQPAPPPLQEGRHRHLVPMPESKANISVEMILRDAGLSAVRWREINNIIRDLMARVGMDYTSSWTRQNKQAMGALYAWILEEVPELAIFRNGWASEWIVQRKFDNRLYNMRKKKREPEAAANGAPDEQHDLPAGLASVARHASEPSAQGSTNNTPPPEADTELQHSSSHPRPRPSESHQHSAPPPRDLVQPQSSPLPSNQQPPSGPSLPPSPTLPQHPDPHSSPALITNRNSRSRRGRDPHPPPFSNRRRSMRISGNHVDGANTAAGTDIQAATTPSGGNNKRQGNQNAPQNKKKRVRKGDLPMPSLEDTDDGAQPTTDEE
ncbi:hypothetical protein V565_357730 [Rhizoctonia solani 123E]|uniref:Uncharacterized protein n=2 Tax=Rhizoctonia solani AG-3 TaxID=1086053 RepID=A0A074RCI1_9AGAM|nr:hypothetical protein V565_357730 [Rhizoctonia solani 123E]